MGVGGVFGLVGNSAPVAVGVVGHLAPVGCWVVGAGSDVVPLPRNKLLVQQIFDIGAPRFYAAYYYITRFFMARF